MLTDDEIEERQMQTNLIWIMTYEIRKRNKFLLPMVFGGDTAEKIDDIIAHLDYAVNIMRELTGEPKGKNNGGI